MSDKSFYINPLPVCTEIYGAENVNDVRDCFVDSIYRYNGPESSMYRDEINKTVQCSMVDILKQAGKNPKAVRLALSPSHLQPAFFVTRYLETRDVEKAYHLALQDCGDNEDFKRQCYIDMRALIPSGEAQPKHIQNQPFPKNKVSPYK